MKRKRTWVRLLASDIVRDHLAAGFTQTFEPVVIRPRGVSGS
jgi:hypothetical protein